MKVRLHLQMILVFVLMGQIGAQKTVPATLTVLVYRTVMEQTKLMDHATVMEILFGIRTIIFAQFSVFHLQRYQLIVSRSVTATPVSHTFGILHPFNAKLTVQM
jgi:hypothetical protein